jgi:hypothetical protein
MPLNLHAGLDKHFLVRTEAGAQEMRERNLGLTQKVRILLVLADGKRTVGEVRKLMAASGVDAEKLQHLLDIGLLNIVRSTALDGAGFVHSAPISQAPGATLRQAAAPPASAPVTAPATAPASAVARPAQASMPAPPAARAPAAYAVMPEPDIEPAVLAVRSHLAQALPALLPQQTAALMFRLGGCTTRQAMQALLQEVESKPQPTARAREFAEMLRHARALLEAG